MSDSTSPPIPLTAAVQVLRFRPNPTTQVLKPWPVATIEIGLAGQITFRGDAAKAYEPLLRACRKAGMKLADQSIRQALLEARELKKEAEL